jgi:hypothetical protein
MCVCACMRLQIYVPDAKSEDGVSKSEDGVSPEKVEESEKEPPIPVFSGIFLGIALSVCEGGRERASVCVRVRVCV